jgi:hypothetical protein
MPIFNSREENLIRNWDQNRKYQNNTKAEQIRIKLITTQHSSDKFLAIAEKLAQMSPGLIIDSEKTESNLPGFLLKENIMYSAFPLAKELEPFLDALEQSNGNPSQSSTHRLSQTNRKALETIEIPVSLKLYIALQCPHCPEVVRTLIPMALNCSNINLHIIDGSLFPETAQKDSVMSAPCLIVDDDFRWTGKVSSDEILNMIKTRDPSQLSVDTLKTVLEQGDAAWITKKMIEKQSIFGTFIELILHETWSVRLGAMVIVEELAESDPKLASKLCPILIDRFDENDITIKGDILYALGESGTKKTSEWIKQQLPQLDHQDLIDTAKEAVEIIESKYTDVKI